MGGLRRAGNIRGRARRKNHVQAGRADHAGKSGTHLEAGNRKGTGAMKAKRPAKKPTTKKAAPRTQEQRRRDTQERVLTAAINILADRGYAHLTTTAVAAKAGVSRGAQENYFPTKTVLIAAATAHAMDEAIRQAMRAADRGSKAKDPLPSFLEHN